MYILYTHAYKTRKFNKYIKFQLIYKIIYETFKTFIHFLRPNFCNNLCTIKFSSVIFFIFVESRDVRSNRYSLPPRTSLDDGTPGNNNNNGKNGAR